MTDALKFYIGGAWVEPRASKSATLIDPATEEAFARVSLGGTEDVDRAVEAARGAFHAYANTRKEERIALLERVVAAYEARLDDLATTINREMGAPRWLAREVQAPLGLIQLNQAIDVLRDYKATTTQGSTLVVTEPIGVCGFITPWNFPTHQVMCKVAPALAVGCTMVLKPSEVTPLSTVILAEIMDAAGVPAGVFNLVHGDGAGVGAAIASHPAIDMVSITGSTRAGRAVAKAAADSVKRVTQELGGKSANVILLDADLDEAVSGGLNKCFFNSGQACNAPSRMLVHADQHAEVLDIARRLAESLQLGEPGTSADGVLGPVATKAQYDKVQGLIQAGIREGADLVCGGVGKPEGFARGYYVKPTVFGNVTNTMTIAREEIFGPVLSILPYETEQDAVALANDTPYGLSGYVWSADMERALAVASKLRTGMVHINGAPIDSAAPFGGYKQSGNGREFGAFGFEEYLETKSVMGALGTEGD